MFAKLAYVLNGMFIEEIPELLESATAPDGKGKSVFEVDHTMKELAENTQKNFTKPLSTETTYLQVLPYHQRPLINKV